MENLRKHTHCHFQTNHKTKMTKVQKELAKGAKRELQRQASTPFQNQKMKTN